MLENALLFDNTGARITQRHCSRSRDWDEVRSFCDAVYMPYQVCPVGRPANPDATMHAAQVGRIMLSRFRYGVPVRLWDFSPDAGKILVYTAIGGAISHGVGPRETVTTRTSESFVVDCTRGGFYWNEGGADHLNINVTVPHDLLEDISQRWYDVVPDDRLWGKRTNFGGGDSCWLTLLDYVARTLARIPDQFPDGRVAAYLEEMLGSELLRSWARSAGVSLCGGTGCAAPRYVRRAEQFMEAHAIEVPTMAQVAAVAGVSVRCLSEGFRRFRNTTPSAFLREQRLKGIRADLLEGQCATVAEAASRWGYVNFGVFARAYRRRFGILPSEVLGCGRVKVRLEKESESLRLAFGAP